MTQAKHKQINFSYKESLKYTSQLCKNHYMVHMLVCQISDAIQGHHYLAFQVISKSNSDNFPF